MELRSRIPAYARRAAVMAAFGALLAPATAGAATATTTAKKKVKRYPTISSVRPMDANIGGTITIRGRNFKPGRGKNSVVFKRDGGRAVFVKADVGTRKLLKVKLPAKLTDALLMVNGAPSTTRFRLRVLAERLGKKFTTARLSPRVGPELPPAPPVPPQSQPDGDCDADGAINRNDSDDDNDLLADTLETSLRLDGCKPDTDGDEVEDGYEYRSALDWNDDEYQAPNNFLFYPTKLPYPNALDGADADVDHDGDTLTLKEEFDLWRYTMAQGAPRDLGSLAYSAGEQYTRSSRNGSGRRVPTLAAAGYDKQVDFLSWASGAGYATVMLAEPESDWFTSRNAYDIRDFNRSGGAPTSVPVGNSRAAETTYYDGDDNDWLSDDERDEDADGLTNFQETRGCMNRDFWDKLYDKESPYYLSYGGTRLDDGDSDGDGVRDGADDNDHDDVPNVMECGRNIATNLAFDPRPAAVDPPPSRLLPPTVYGFVNPFNPCVPSTTSRSCNQHPALNAPWAPYNANDKYFYVWN